MRYAPRLIVSVAMAGLTLLGLVRSRAFADPTGAAVLSRAHGDALVIWDATDTLRSQIGSKSSASQIMRQIESDACTILRQKSKVLPVDATSLSVEVIYQKIGDVSPAYQVATFGGIEHLLTIRASLTDLRAQGEQWQADFNDGKMPKKLTVTLTGKLPPGTE